MRKGIVIASALAFGLVLVALAAWAGQRPRPPVPDALDLIVRTDSLRTHLTLLRTEGRDEVVLYRTVPAASAPDSITTALTLYAADLDSIAYYARAMRDRYAKTLP